MLSIDSEESCSLGRRIRIRDSTLRSFDRLFFNRSTVTRADSETDLSILLVFFIYLFFLRQIQTRNKKTSTKNRIRSR